jgi:hypothetical protein
MQEVLDESLLNKLSQKIQKPVVERIYVDEQEDISFMQVVFSGLALNKLSQFVQ